MNNVLTISFGGRKKVVSPQMLTQWDTGQILRFIGINLPEIYSVDFSYNGKESISALGTRDGVRIPDAMFNNYGNLHAWFVLSDGIENSKTEYEVVIPVKQKAKPGSMTDGDEEVRSDQYSASVSELLERAGNAVLVSESNVEKYPKIIDKYWYVYNPLTREWDNTGVAGEAISIDTIVSNPDYTLTITLEDGRQFTTGSMRGEQGAFPDVDSELSSSSVNPVENRAVFNALDGIYDNLSLKVDKVDGKGLSSNDFTDEYKDVLDDIIESQGSISGDSITIGETTITEEDFVRLLSIIDGDNLGYGDIESPQVDVGQADHMIVADGHEEENTIDVGAIGHMILQHPENSIFVGTAVVGTSALAE